MSESVHEILKAYLLDLGREVKDARGKPYYEVFHVYQNIKCKNCGKVIAEPKELITKIPLRCR